VAEVFTRPRHPYTRGLLKCQPTLDNVSFDRETLLPSIPGQVPSLTEMPSGCAFRTRCELAVDRCLEVPALEHGPHGVACWRPLETAPLVAALAAPDTGARS